MPRSSRRPSRAQAKPAAQTPAAPAAPQRAGQVGPATEGRSHRRVRPGHARAGQGRNPDENQGQNTSKGSIALLSVEEIWYNSKREIASNGIYRHKQLLNPGDIIEFIISSPEKPDLQHEHADVQARQRDDQAEPGRRSCRSTAVQSFIGLSRLGSRGVGSRS